MRTNENEVWKKSSLHSSKSLLKKGWVTVLQMRIEVHRTAAGRCLHAAFLHCNNFCYSLTLINTFFFPWKMGNTYSNTRNISSSYLFFSTDNHYTGRNRHELKFSKLYLNIEKIEISQAVNAQRGCGVSIFGYSKPDWTMLSANYSVSACFEQGSWTGWSSKVS